MVEYLHNMKIQERLLNQVILQDLKSKKMVFIGGPRQVGKTTLAKFIGKNEFKNYEYLNWDTREHRKKILQNEFSGDTDFIIFDELHKFRKWKNHIKGIYDEHKEDFSIIVTGSARLDLYRKGGDSLLGRYHYYRLHPFSFGELIGNKKIPKPFSKLDFPKEESEKNLEALFKFGGFPEPLFAQNEKILRRWHNERIDRLVGEDIRDVELIHDISAIQQLVEILPEKVAAPLSLNTLREDFQVTHKTIALWVDILERFYYHFRIYPYSGKAIRSLKKEPKMYLWDWSEITDESKKFENMIASHLLKLTHYLHDAEGYKAELYYLRDTAGREVDFLVTVNKKPWFAVEVKMNDTEPSKNLKYFADRLKIPHLFQVIHKSKTDILQGKTRIMSAEYFLSGFM